MMRKRTLWYILVAVLCCCLMVGATQIKRVSQLSGPTVATSQQAPKPFDVAKKPVVARQNTAVNSDRPVATAPRQNGGSDLSEDQKAFVRRILDMKAAGQSPNSQDAARWRALTTQVVSDRMRHSLDQGNDNCPATHIAGLPYSDTGTTVGATHSITLACGSTSTSPDVLYEYTAPATGTDTVSLCGSSYDTEVGIYTGTCPGTTSVACDDDDYTHCATGSNSWISYPVTAGTQYFIVVSAWSGGSGAYVINVTGTVPSGANDFACTGITSPLGGAHDPSSVVTVTATVANAGTATQSSPVKYIFNGGAPVTETTSVLAQGASESHTFATNITLPATPGTYTLKVFTDLVGDVNHSNDTTSMDILVMSCTQNTPWSDNMDAAVVPALPACWASEMHTAPIGGPWATNTTNPHSAPNDIFIGWDPAQLNDWLFTPGLHLVGGTTYQLSYWYAALSASWPETWEILYGTAQSSAAMTSGTILSSFTFSQTAYVRAAITFTPAATGTYYIGWHATSVNALGIYLDDVVVGPPSTSGRCCYGDPSAPSCAVNTSAQCAALSGNWLADGTCELNPCPVVPPNDDCANVTPQNLPATFTGTRDGATPDCPSFAIGEGNVWIAFILPNTFPTWNVVLDYCGSHIDPGYSSDCWLNLAIGCPCTGFTAAAAFNNTSCPSDANYTMTWSGMAAGTYYYPVMLDIANGATGPYTIHVSATGIVPPPNDNCGSVTPVSLPATFTGDNTNASHDCSLLTLGNGETWHAFTTTQCQDITVNYCGTTPAFTDIYIVLADACPCGNLFYANTWDNTTCGDGNFTAFYPNVPAGTWYLPVLNETGNAIGPYTIHVSGAACQAGPANDICANAIHLTGDVSALPWDNTRAHTEADAPTFCPMYNDIWYCWYTPCEVDVNMTTCGSNINTKLAVFNTDANCTCPVGTGVICNDDTTCGALTTNSAVTFHALPGRYLIEVGSALPYGNGHFGTGVLNITNSAPCVCDPATAVTAYLNATGHAQVRFSAPTTVGRYQIYKTTNKNNDGDPRGGDPMFTLAGTIVAAATGIQVWDDPNTPDPYMNYVVVHDCAPLGRCCYGDPGSPSCAVDIAADCATLSGTWTRGATCDSPCPTLAPNRTCQTAQVITGPGTYSGDNSRADSLQPVPLQSCGSGGWFPLWYSYTPAIGGTVTVNCCTQPGFDTVLDCITGPCGGTTTSMGCADDGCSTVYSSSPGFSFTAAAGTTYYFRVCSYFTTNSPTYRGQFNLQVVGP